MKAIIIVDMLKGFLEPGVTLFCGEKARLIIPRIVSLLERESTAQRIYLCDHHAAFDREFMMFPPHCVEGTSETEIIPELEPYPGVVIKKTRYSGFFNTELAAVLEDIKPAEVIVVGVCTDICVNYTAADLRNRDYSVTIYADCVASFDEEAHNFMLKHQEKVLGVNVVATP